MMKRCVNLLVIQGLALVFCGMTQAESIPSIPVHGFVDAGYVFSSAVQPADERAKAFTLGDFDLYFIPRVPDRVHFLSQLKFNARSGTTKAELERLQVGYDVSETLKVSVGKFHTPFGYWNTTFRSGAKSQTSVLNPKFLNFEDQGGVLPTHTIGLLFEGKLHFSGQKAAYSAWLGNAGQISGGRLSPADYTSDSNDIVLGLNTRFELGGAFRGAKAGIHTYVAQINQYDSSKVKTNRYHRQVSGLYLVYDVDAFEMVSEYYVFKNYFVQPFSGPDFGGLAGYAQLGYHVTESLLPYFRIERAYFNLGDPYFQALDGGRSYTRGLVGTRLEMSSLAALKFEFNKIERGDENLKYYEIRTQVAVSF